MQCTVASELVDDDALERMLREREHVGTSWRAQRHAPPDMQGDPTYAWSVRLPDGRVGIELALFTEYEELVALVRPAALTP